MHADCTELIVSLELRDDMRVICNRREDERRVIRNATEQISAWSEDGGWGGGPRQRAYPNGALGTSNSRLCPPIYCKTSNFTTFPKRAALDADWSAADPDNPLIAPPPSIHLPLASKRIVAERARWSGRRWCARRGVPSDRPA